MIGGTATDVVHFVAKSASDVAYGPSIINGVIALIGVGIGVTISGSRAHQGEEKRNAITLGQVAAAMSRIEDGQKDMWEALDDVRDRLARLEGPKYPRVPGVVL